MVKLNKNVRNIALSALGIFGSIMFFKKFRTPSAPKDIPAFFSNSEYYLFAHRGGMALRPEQTQLAFDLAANYGMDGFETDVRVTKDDQLIVFHDLDLDRTTNGSGNVSDHTLEELKRLDAGYHFTDLNGNHPYRGHQHAKILTFDELLSMYPNHLVNVDLKDDPTTHQGQQAPRLMYEAITRQQAQDRVLVTSFDINQTQRFRAISQGEIAIGANQREVAEGFLKFMLGLGHTFQPQADTFQMPVTFKGIRLAQPRFIQWLNSRNIVPGFYGVNNLDLMQDLINQGVHTLVTDRPDLAKRFRNTPYNSKL